MVTWGNNQISNSGKLSTSSDTFTREIVKSKMGDPEAGNELVRLTFQEGYILKKGCF